MLYPPWWTANPHISRTETPNLLDSSKVCIPNKICALGPAYNEFGYYISEKKTSDWHQCLKSWIKRVSQECIPVGCVPPTAVAVSKGGVSTMHPLTRHPPPPGPGTHPWTRPPRTMHPPPPPDQAPPRDHAPSPCEQNHTRLWKYNLAPTSLRAVIMSTNRFPIWKRHCLRIRILSV